MIIVYVTKKRVSFIIFFGIIAIVCATCSSWQIKRYHYKKYLKEKIINFERNVQENLHTNNNKKYDDKTEERLRYIDFEQKSYHEILLSEMNEFDVGNFTAQVISDKVAELGWYSAKAWQKDILVLTEIEGKKVIISLGSIDTNQTSENDFKNHKNLEKIKENMKMLPKINGNFMRFQPKKNSFANSVREDESSNYFPMNTLSLGSFSTFRKDYFERYWETEIDYPFALINVQPNEKYFEKSTLLPFAANVKVDHHIFYAGMWVFYSILALIYLILNNKKL